MHDHFALFANYNAWANRWIFDAAAGLSDEDYRRDCGVFFKSMHGTLNHILVADQIWMRRFTGQGEALTRLDAIVHTSLVDLRQARDAMDERIRNWIAGLDEEQLAGTFVYTPITEPEASITEALAPALAHFFNHQTHHRGHAHGILTQLTGEAPSLDLIYYLREIRLGLQR